MHQMLYHIVSKNVKYKFWAFSFPFSKGTFLSLPDDDVSIYLLVSFRVCLCKFSKLLNEDSLMV